MAVRSTTARRLATVIVATAAVSALGAGATSAASNPARSTTSTDQAQVTVPPLSLPQVETLLDSLLGTVDGLLGDQLGVRTAAEIEADEDKPLLGKTVDNLTKTTKELPLLGGAVGGLTDGLGLSEPTRVAEVPTTPTPANPAKPAAPAAGKPDTGKLDRGIDSIAPAGSTWTAPMEQMPTTPVVRNEDKPAPGGFPGFINDVKSIFPTNAAEAAAAGAGAATIALIVLGGIAVTGAAGAASSAGRRGLINGSVGGSL